MKKSKMKTKRLQWLCVALIMVIWSYVIRWYSQSDNWDTDEVSFTTQSDWEYNCDSVSTIPKDECRALVDLYGNTQGENWTTNERWVRTKNPCSRRGVFCEEGHVTTLNLSRNNLQGMLPATISWLTELEALFLWDNSLTGKIPYSIWSLTKLRHIELGKNNFSWSIPQWLAKTWTESNDIHIFINNNNLCNTVPEELRTNWWIELIDANNNNLTLSESEYSDEMWQRLSKVLTSWNIENQSPEFCQ